ncbi:hypothetical protein SPSIL_053920 [Sporomusa silvacetica DSM 10669]|uniref:Uncharacterized protein n=1 Tax=Sporomusa silvacetica DSM 10669 TaxID=1123289 RepID=A0ABZ3IUR4_9FIRM|nr:hypothetical protein SPSIL_19460 [Sporomusa silvacetica DSM 10669]
MKFGNYLKNLIGCIKEGKDTTDTIQRFGEVLEEFLLFRQQGGKDPLVKGKP